MAMNYYDKFVAKLQEIFMMDHAELDFGIYRIMNQKRDEIQHFLQVDLLPQVKLALQGDGGKTQQAKQRMAEIEQMFAGMDIETLPDSNPNVAEYKKLKAQLAQGGNAEDMEGEVFSHLVTFFSRYYDGGDFLSKRRYKDNTYAIPYNGEEVKLHWANSDQYYIKTSEYFRDYTFVLPTSRKKVHFVLKDASTEQNNNRATNNMERRFALWEPANEGEQVVEVTAGGDLNIYFTYELMPKTTKQKDLMAAALVAITPLVPAIFEEVLTAKAPTKDNPNRTLLEKHLTDYTAKNSFDYFIHKDLGGFLSRELDFYIKNEVLHIDDLDPQHINSQLSIVKAIKQVGQKIIQMMAQLENFQKKLWLKKKFVVQSDYCITLDRVPEELYPEIITNDAQRKEWVRLFAIDEIQEDLHAVGYSEPLAIEFLKQNQFLVLDTAFFDDKFKHQLVKSMENIDEQTNGLLINSENFQALQLLQEKYINSIGAVITDPPYNTGDDDFLYKDNYLDSSWITMMNDRMAILYHLMKDESWCSFNINDIELFNLMKLADRYDWSSKTNITVKMSHLSGMKMSHIDKKIPKIMESILVFSKGNEYVLNPIYEPCSWDEAFERYTSWVDFNDSNTPEDWRRTTVREAAQRYHVDSGNKESFDAFRLKHANQIFRTAVNDTLLSFPRDNKFHAIKSANGLEKLVYNREEVLFSSTYLREIDGQKVPAQPKGDMWTDIGINNVHNEGGVQLPNGKKPVKLFERLIKMLSNNGDIILDPFAGSATIVHAAINTNGNNKYIAIQSDCSYFNEKTKRRAENVVYSSEWKLDKPVSRQGISQCFKYIRLEQYEDTLNNLEIKKQQLELQPKEFQESYMLSYLLDTETRDSLLNLKWFENPFEMTLKTTKDNELVETKVDMVETFNYLIGLNVETEDWYQDDNICVVQGKSHRVGLKTLVIWRNCKEVNNDQLCEFLGRRAFRTRDTEFDLIYVNGDNTLPNLRRDEEHWKVVLTEEEFAIRMFDV